MTLTFSALDAHNFQDVDDWIALRDAAQHASTTGYPSISPAAARLELLHSSPYKRRSHLLAKSDARAVGAVAMELPLHDNLHLADVTIEVHPDHWGAGVGSELLSRAERIAAEAGRTTLTGYVPAPLLESVPTDPGGRRFAERRGFVVASSEVARRADLSDPRATDPKLLERCWERADGYELVQWTRRAPDDVVDDVAYLSGRLNLDAPTGDSAVEAEVHHAARVRDAEHRRLVGGKFMPTTAVRHRQTGRVAGLTAIEIEPGEEEHCWQAITLVDPRDRRRGLGTILKLENHRYVLSYRPRMRFVHTWNDEANHHMAAINEAIGYLPRERSLVMQKKLA